MQKLALIPVCCLLLVGHLQAASLNNGSIRPRSERAEANTNGGVGHHSSQQGSVVNQTSGEQLEFDFVNLPGYGVLDDANSSQSGNFSCYQRRYGYYADVARQCSLFHLCYPVKEPNTGDIIYQRFSFACSDQSQFDQQHLLCLEPSAVITPCELSEEHFETANHRLISALQQSAPGLFALSEEGAVLNTTNTVDTGTASAESTAMLDGSALVDESGSLPLAYGHEQFYV